jgi:hypothetical protein
MNTAALRVDLFSGPGTGFERDVVPVSERYRPSAAVVRRCRRLEGERLAGRSVTSLPLT